MLVQEKLTAVNFTNRNEAFVTKQTKEILPFVTTYSVRENFKQSKPDLERGLSLIHI